MSVSVPILIIVNIVLLAIRYVLKLIIHACMRFITSVML